MQDRMASGSAALGLIYRAVFGTLFPLFRFAARAFARRERGYEIADQVMAAFAALRPKYLDAVRANMARITGRKADHPEVERLALRMMRQHARAWVDFFRYAQRPPEEALALLEEVDGLERLKTGLSEGRGAILLTAHAGNYELGGMVIGALGHPIHMVYVPDRFPAVERLRAWMRARAGVVGLPVAGSGFATLPLAKVLREGGLVGMQGDRDFNLKGLPIPFFGQEVHFPRGPWELAAMTGAPIYSCFFTTDDEGRFHARLGEPIRLSAPRGERHAEIEAGMRQYAADLEALVRERPDQWYCFYPFWEDPARHRNEPRINNRE